MTVERMDHVGIVVDDLEAATAFSLELGMELELDVSIPERNYDLIGTILVRAIDEQRPFHSLTERAATSYVAA